MTGNFREPGQTESPTLDELTQRLNDLEGRMLKVRLAQLKQKTVIHPLAEITKKSTAGTIVRYSVILLLVAAYLYAKRHVLGMDNPLDFARPAASSTLTKEQSPDPKPSKSTERPKSTHKRRPSTEKEPANKETRYKKFRTHGELCRIVDEYLNDNGSATSAAKTYGHPIGTWDVSLIEDFSHVFSAGRNPKAANFNEDIGDWDVGKATNMEKMFYQARMFNQGLSKWNVGRLKEV